MGTYIKRNFKNLPKKNLFNTLMLKKLLVKEIAQTKGNEFDSNCF